MDEPLDIFRIVPEGVRRIGTVQDLEAAKALIQAKSAEQSGDYGTNFTKEVEKLNGKPHYAPRQMREPAKKPN